MSIQYNYYVQSIGTKKEPAYKAIIPAFNNAVVFGENLEELEEGIELSIEEEIKEYKKAKKGVPLPEKEAKVSGKILIRVAPMLHEKLLIEARANQTSLNKYIEDKLSA